jgi:hypothetical protein
MGLGDIGMKNLDPLDRYFDIINNPAVLPRRPWNVKPDREKVSIPGMDGFQALLEKIWEPDQWQMLVDFLKLLKSDVLFTKKPNWLEPPITATQNELISETPVAILAAATDILKYTVPDRCVAVVTAFGNALDNPVLWGTVVWNVLVNNKPVKNWQDFLLQRGMIYNPTKLTLPFVLPPNAVFEVTAKSVSAVNGFARCSGYVFPLKFFTQDGTYRDYQTK